MLDVGDFAPDFTLAAEDGAHVTLSALHGRSVVLYFYPRDDSPGCTAQACGIRDVWNDFQSAGAVVLGVSPQDERSHARFKARYGLPFTLLADPDHAVAEAYGVWVEKTLYGKKSMGIERSTFVIAADGHILRAFRKVKPEEHAAQVLEALA